MGPSDKRDRAGRAVTPASPEAAAEPAATSAVVATEDAWLGRTLGRRSVRITLESSDPSPDAIRAIVASAGRPVFLYAKVDTAAVRQVVALQQAGFCVIDTNVTLEKPVTAGAPPPPSFVRFAEPADATSVEDLAAKSFSYSRFHLDPEIGRETADAVKRAWAGGFFRGSRGDYMVIAEEDGVIRGFLQLLAAGDGRVTIDLIGVDQDCRGRGLATAMIGFAETRIPNSSTIQVGTQVANVGSIRLYERLGFRMRGTTYVLHCHRPAVTER